jgi:hypothetical protein
MPINMFLVKPNSTYECERQVPNTVGNSVPEAEADEFCGFPHLPSDAQLATINWGEFYGD